MSDSTEVVPEGPTRPPMVKGGASEQEGEQGVPELLHPRGKKKISCLCWHAKERKTLASRESAHF